MQQKDTNMRVTPSPVLTASQKNMEKFKRLLPAEGFCVLKPADFKEMMNIIHKEQDPKIKHYYFSQILGRLFAGGWGWYMRLGQSLAGMRPINNAANLPQKKQEDGLAVLRMVKAMHIELKYKPSYITLINGFIREFGGNLMSKEQKIQQRSAKFQRASASLQAGEKVPRKLKKAIIAQKQKTK